MKCLLVALAGLPAALCVRAWIAVGIASGGALPLQAAPFVPADDAVVLETLPSGPQARRLKAALAQGVRDADDALRVATALVEESRRTSDPRPLGRAQAVLARWDADARPPVAVLVLRATIRQSLHDFSAAREDLRRALEADPGHVQAWLTLATIQQVSGDLPSARHSCMQLRGRVAAIILAACLASVDGASGESARGLAMLTTAIARAPGGNADVMAWVLSLQAELAARVDDVDLAERAFRVALALQPGDAYARGAYADFLIDRGRAPEVLRLIDRQTPVDALLLRYVIAARSAQDAAAEDATRRLARRVEAAALRGDRTHLREEARFRLQVLEDAPAALRLALQNWAVQREPADARLVLEAAVAARDPKSASEVVRWIRESRLEGREVAALLSRLERA